MQRILVWDLPVRTFHWLLVALVGAAWGSVELEWMTVHEWCGYSVLALLVFRLLWGLFGSDNARFSNFLRHPREGVRYLRELRSGTPAHYDTHNPAGGWGAVLLLILLALQAGTGLFAADDVTFQGPFNSLVSEQVADWLKEFHEFNFNLILAMAGVHILAVVWHQRLGERLVQAMWHGYKDSPLAATRQRPVWLAVITLAVAVGAVWWLLSLAPPVDAGGF